MLGGILNRFRAAGGAARTAPSGGDAAPPPPSAASMPRAPRAPLVIPTIRPPQGLGGLALLVSACYMTKVSADLTHAGLSPLFGGMTWEYALMLQIVFSLIERFHFVGNRSGLTWAVLIADGIINAAGLFFDAIPRLFETPMWRMLATGGDVVRALYNIVMFGPVTVLLAILLGCLFAYGNDKLFSMAMGER